jgi:hypothetical protein
MENIQDAVLVWSCLKINVEKFVAAPLALSTFPLQNTTYNEYLNKLSLHTR